MDKEKAKAEIADILKCVKVPTAVSRVAVLSDIYCVIDKIDLKAKKRISSAGTWLPNQKRR